ncbi:hypothetical protein SC09_Contig19orf01238 [Bacillus subtilis]|uniref:Uncharacterized protein n=1 Tax=Bacillus subtilis TaxID=1423 RepID=A0A0D1LA08_BACIU|nr:hypothetical protein SC09_Contig19orf01238 [Bacillus subtilis]
MYSVTATFEKRAFYTVYLEGIISLLRSLFFVLQAGIE